MFESIFNWLLSLLLNIQIRPSFPNFSYNWCGFFFFLVLCLFVSLSFSLQELEWVGLSVCLSLCVYLCLFVHRCPCPCFLWICEQLTGGHFLMFVSWRHVQYALGFEDCHSHTVSIFSLFCVDLRATRSPIWSGYSLNLSACPGVPTTVYRWRRMGEEVVLLPW